MDDRTVGQTSRRYRLANTLGAAGLIVPLVLAALVGVVGAHAYMSQASWRVFKPAGQQTTMQTNTGPAGFADIVDMVKPAVIGVQAKVVENEQRSSGSSPDRFFRQFGVPQRTPDATDIPRAGKVTAQGSGFFISADGYAVTNSHVVEGTTMAEIQTDDQKTYTARVVGTDPVSDLALLKVEGRTDFAFVRLADHAPRVGDWVLAIGNPFGLGGTVTAGIVSARERNVGALSYENLVQIDAPINKGDSGGPTFDLTGRVIGVNTMIFSPSGGSIGIAFAVSAETVKKIVPQLKDKGSVTRGWLGIQIQQLTPEIAAGLGLKPTQGVLVAEAETDSPADKAGILPGDIIVSLDGLPVKDTHQLSSTISAMAPGSSIKVGFLRRNEENSVNVTLDEAPAKSRQATADGDEQTTARGKAHLGLKLTPAGRIQGAGPNGVVVTDIEPGGLAADQGVELGDIILEVSGRPVNSSSDLQTAFDNARDEGKATIVMRIRSGDTTRFVAMPIG